MDTFWIVWCENGNVPTVKHFQEDTARKEAERIARLTRGACHVLQVVGTVRTTDIQWTSYGDVPVPF